MIVVFEIEKGHSANAVMIENVVEYKCVDKQNGTYKVTYKDPNYLGNPLFDIYIKHVISVKEVQA